MKMTAVPKTTINKHGQSRLGEHKVRAPKYARATAPPMNFERFEYLY